MSDFDSAFDEDLINDLFKDSSEEFDFKTLFVLDKSRNHLLDNLPINHPKVGVVEASYLDDIEPLLDEIDCVVIECRVIEGFTDLKFISQIREIRPLVPIVAVSRNLDAEFMVAAYEHGVIDYISDEVTDDVLVAKIRNLVRLAESSKFLETKNEEVVETMKSLRSSREKLKSAIHSRINAETQKEFADEIAAANKQTREILDSLREGFFVINPDLSIGDTTSASCEGLFGSEIASKHLGSALNLKDSQETYIRLNMEQLFDGFMPVEVTLSMLPRRVQTTSEMFLDLKYSLVNDKEGNPERVIVVASNCTDGVRREQKFERKLHRINGLFFILRSRSAFIDFLSDFKNGIEYVQSSRNRDSVLRTLHTLKGNSGVYHLDLMTRFIHDLESDLTRNQYNDEEFFTFVAAAALRAARKMESFLRRYRGILEIDYNVAKTGSFILTEDRITRLEQLASRRAKGAKRRLLDEIQSLRYRPISLLANSLVQVGQRTAQKLGKSIEVSLSNENIHVDLDKLSPLFRNLVHIINNACDHGIESSEARRMKDKPEMGRIRISFEAKEQTLTITIQDDGQGMSCERLKAVARQKQLMSDQALDSLSEEQTFHLIFLDGFSTSLVISDTSGRGVGMSAVKEEIERLGGEITICSAEGEGTTFSFRIPKVGMALTQGDVLA